MELKDICINNASFRKIMKIFNNSKINPPKRYKRHRHHIIPQCWFKMNNLPVDNSDNNLIYLSIQNHYNVHKLMCDCVINDKLKHKMYASAELLKEKFGDYIKDDNKKKSKNRRHNLGKIMDKKLSYIKTLTNNEKILYMKSLNNVYLNMLIKRIVTFYVEQYNIECNKRKFIQKLNSNLPEVITLLDKITLKWLEGVSEGKK